MSAPAQRRNDPAITVDHGYLTVGLRTRLISARVPVRALAVSVTLFGLALATGVLALRYGEYPLTVGEVLAAATGGGQEFQRMIVLEWRLPVVAAALLFGAVLGLGGAIFQSLTRNPLGSPDVIGFDAGAYTAVLTVILVVGTRDYWSLATAAVLGGVGTAVVVYVLAYRRGMQGFRLIIVGIGVSAMLGSVNNYLITRAELDDAIAVGFWGAGSVSRVTWASLVPAATMVVAIVVASMLLAPALRRLELGDDTAVTHGTHVQTSRLALVLLGVATSALVTAAAGPIGFIALVAPQVARRLTRTPGVSLLPAAATGALLLSSAQLLSLLGATVYRPVPVGLITVCVGGVYLIWLLVREARRQQTGPID